MRELKFRAWFNGMGEPFEPFDPVFLSDGGTFPDGTIFMQYTGLKDKNGKEIYEGDILRSFHFKDYKKEYFLLHRVVWDQEHTGWEAASLDNKSDNLTLAGNTQLWVYKRNAENPEIIGNIYENPELIKHGNNL